MQLASGTYIPDGLLAANALLSEKLHQGSAASTHTLHQGFGFVISSTPLGIEGSLYDGDVRSRYTGKERDAESGLDYFGARYYGSNMGRFLSPDPTGGSLLNPQTLNKYSYGLNNPLVYTDPTGLDCIHINNDTGAFESFDSGDCNNSTPELANTGQYIDGTVNNISLNQQGQVLGYSGNSDNGSSINGSFMSAGAGEVFNVNPYTGVMSSSEFGQTVNVTGNSPGTPDTNLVGVSSLIPLGGLQAPSGIAVMRAASPAHKMSAGEIRSWCRVATILGNSGIAPSSAPSEDTPANNMLVPSETARYPGATREMETRQMDPGSGEVGNPVNALAILGSYASCVDAVSAANR
jgi:RHS repeat-associated protein